MWRIWSVLPSRFGVGFSRERGRAILSPDLSIIIPLYNESGNVPKIQREFFPVAAALAASHALEVLFVDDGSTDGTWQALTETLGNDHPPQVAVRFERHTVNRGLGAALRTGFAAAQGEVV